MERRERKRGFFSKPLGVLLIFAIGVAAGYYLGERGKAEAVAEAVRETEASVSARAKEAAARGGAALQNLGGGAAAAAESAKAAVRTLRGDTAGGSR